MKNRRCGGPERQTRTQTRASRIIIRLQLVAHTHTEFSGPGETNSKQYRPKCRLTYPRSGVCPCAPADDSLTSAEVRKTVVRGPKESPRARPDDYRPATNPRGGCDRVTGAITGWHAAAVDELKGGEEHRNGVLGPTQP